MFGAWRACTDAAGGEPAGAGLRCREMESVPKRLRMAAVLQSLYQKGVQAAACVDPLIAGIHDNNQVQYG
mgnify:CR=1 FL=1